MICDEVHDPVFMPLLSNRWPCLSFSSLRCDFYLTPVFCLSRCPLLGPFPLSTTFCHHLWTPLSVTFPVCTPGHTLPWLLSPFGCRWIQFCIPCLRISPWTWSSVFPKTLARCCIFFYSGPTLGLQNAVGCFTLWLFGIFAAPTTQFPNKLHIKSYSFS